MRLGYYGGTWDVLHVGHVNALAAARSLCDHLIVGVAVNEIYSKLKGCPPVRDWIDRMTVIKAIQYADTVVPYDTEDPYDVWTRYHFDVLFTSDEYYVEEPKKLIMKRIVDAGVEVVYLTRTPNISSTTIKHSIQGASGPQVPEYA